MTGWLLALIAMLYVAGLFGVAWYGDRIDLRKKTQLRSYIYGLSLAVYCSSWSFFGTVGQASTDPWSFVPVFLGPLLMFTLFWKVLNKLILVSKKANITSIADFIASRHGKSRGLAALVTFILVLGSLPYIALQLKAIVMGFDLLSFRGEGGVNLQDLVLVVTVLLAVFVIIFGTRRIDTTEHQQGVMTAIAFESVLKLVAFLVVGGWVCWTVFGAGEATFSLPDTRNWVQPAGNWFDVLIFPTFIMMASVVCLPREFHAIVVENSNIKDFHRSRWLFPLYLVLVSALVLPLTYAGKQVFGNSVPADSYVILLPQALGSEAMAVLVYMGGVSAAISMVIVATLALSTMVSNEILMPVILRSSRNGERNFYRFSGLLLNVRRTVIIALLLLTYLLYRLMESSTGIPGLAGLGQLSLGAVIQLLPAVLGGLYIRDSNHKAVYLGLLAGASVWLFTLVVPLFVQGGWLPASIMQDGLFGVPGLKPQSLFGFEATSRPFSGTLIAFVVNSLLYIAGCFCLRPSGVELRQAHQFMNVSEGDSESYRHVRITKDELQALLVRFVDAGKVEALMGETLDGVSGTTLVDREALLASERLLAGVMGATSAKVVMKASLAGGQMRLEDVEAIVDEASEVLQFNRELLQGAIENLEQGVSVVDKNLQLVAWNRRYVELFEYPETLITVGRPVEEIIDHNARRGLCGPGSAEEHVLKRVGFMQKGCAHKSERRHPNGRVIEIRGNPMPGGGFVMSFTDITEFRQVEQALKDMNESLEQRVRERTQELSELNRALELAKSQAEAANRSRTRFFAAVSHDLMQPMNAARLFAASLESSRLPEDAHALASHLNSSLESAERLIKDILDMSRLEAGKLRASIREFCLSEVLEPLKSEFDLLAQQEGLDFRLVSTVAWVRSDPNLLRRLLQNFLTNAFRYSGSDGSYDGSSGRVMLVVRRASNQQLRIEVRDNGSGIPEDKQELIFSEFERLRQDGKGLGLGLSIAKGIADVLGHPLQLRSLPGKGTVFSVYLNTVERRVVQQHRVAMPASSLSHLKVLCVDNEKDILMGMSSLLQRWGCKVECADGRDQAVHIIERQVSDVLLMDYQLEEHCNGIELIQKLREIGGHNIPAVLITANTRQNLREQCLEQGIRFLAKPVKPAALRALLTSVVQSSRT
ncbi:PAS domain-containing hybrid sensor histidine kinase/response regulator [Endozoicomonas euniceicola]|uniref:histidine kinase n=1 Tax=Endozoicomonas euniceicola TaxID=1234143 RepID=A0ABY6GS35_9GAMM|nr:PAS-domain containing protein [Endozoicomonas euniceicola]UYM15560.1 PAS-domain containing protein [Endozoicomonas euniceicola]